MCHRLFDTPCMLMAHMIYEYGAHSALEEEKNISFIDDGPNWAKI